ncbi:MAG: ribbon-helix-helix protein, CopG family [Alphaproteobacteria bacterium]|nr:ribbon-helix-helix protein, CopG family [Alphaproteobacteria bacterium]
MITLHLPPAAERRVQARARRMGRSKTALAREAVLRFLDDVSDEAEARRRLARPVRRWTQEELKQGIDVADRMG